MNVITAVVLAAGLVAVSDVSFAAQPATVKTIQPKAVAAEPIATTEIAESGDSLHLVRDAGRQAQQQITRDALSQSRLDRLVMPLPHLLPVSDELVADVVGKSHQLAVK
jgi:hypothetical protein